MIPVVIADLTSACGVDPGIVCEWVYNLTSNEGLAEFVQLISKPINAGVILLVAYFLARIARRLIRRFTDRLVAAQEEKAEEAVEEPSTDGDDEEVRAAFADWATRRSQYLKDQAARGRQRAETLGAVLSSGATIVIWTIAIMIALGEIDLDIGPLIASAGIVGIALGFGAQSLVKDFLSGIFMLIEDQFGVGDIVDVGDAAGVVEAVSLRITQIRDVNGTLWHVPNGEITRVANKSQQWARAVLDLDVAYDTDIGKAFEVIQAAADSVWHDRLDDATILEQPEIWGVERFGPDAVTIRLVAKVEPAEQWMAARQLRARIKEAFDREGIVIPFPQRTVWMHEAPAPSRYQPPPVAAEEHPIPEAKGGKEGEAS
jgi:small conductance mechanosensitive channel